MMRGMNTSANFLMTLLLYLWLCTLLGSVVHAALVLHTAPAPPHSTGTATSTSIADKSALETAIGGSYISPSTASEPPSISQTLIQAHHPFDPSVFSDNTLLAMDSRISAMSPLVGLDFYISLCNIIMDTMEGDPRRLLTFVHRIHDAGHMPIVFIPVDLLMHFVDTLVDIHVPFKLMTLSNFPYCVPYFKFPQMCTEESTNLNVCIRINYLLYSRHLVHWYTKNPCINHPKLIALPIGPKWQQTSHLFFGEDISSTSTFLRQVGLSPYAYFKNHSEEVYSHYQRMLRHSREVNNSSAASAVRPPWFTSKDKLLYVNFNRDTTETPFYGYHKLQRHNLLDTLQAQGFEVQQNESFQDYMLTLSQYQFVIAPPGVGIDTHRTWEALLVGTIPIVLSSPLDALYDDLPVVVVQDFSVITESILRDVYTVLHNRNDLNFGKLYMDYWRKLITSVDS